MQRRSKSYYKQVRIPFFKQQNDYYCGPAVIKMTLAAHGINLSQRTLAREAQTNARIGTGTKGMVQTFKRHHLVISAKNRNTLYELEQALAEKKLVVICYTECTDNAGHYAIVKKIGKKFITLLDPAEKDGQALRLTIGEFQKRWKDPLYTKTLRWAAFAKMASSRKSAH